MKRFALLLCMLTSVLFLSACGASISTTTNFNKDGSGTKTLSASIDYQYEEYIEGGFAALDAVITASVPSSLTLTKVDEPDYNRLVYSITMNFTDIDDYNSQMQALSNGVGTANWNSAFTAFRGSVYYEDSYSEDAMFLWALTAIDDAAISTYTASEMYEISTSYVYYNDELVWDGSYSPYFEIKTGVELDQAAVYTTYDLEGNSNKKIELAFNPDDFAQIDAATAQSELSKYSPDFVIDVPNSKITLDLKDQAAMKTFFNNVANSADNYSDEALFEYTIEDSSIFNYSYKVAEGYSLYNLLNEFTINNTLVNNYIAMPDTLSYNDVYYSSDAGETSDETYRYQSAFYYDDWYTMSFNAEQSVSINNVDVNYTFGKNQSGKIETTINFNKNGCIIDKAKFLGFYSDNLDEKTYVEDGDNVTVAFTKDFKLGDTNNDGSTFFQFNDSNLSSFTEKVYMFDSVYDIQSYLPDMYVDVNYKLIIPDYMDLQFAKLNNNNYYGDLFEDVHRNGNYYYSFISSDSSSISLTFIEKNNLVYIIIAGIIAVILIASAAIFFVIKKKKGPKIKAVKENIA